MAAGATAPAAAAQTTVAPAATTPPETPTKPVEEPVVLPSREERPFALTGSLGWNSLAGFGIGGTFSFDPHVSADVTLGLAAIGLKMGTRVRYNLFESNWTPSFGVGLQFGPGGGGQAVTIQGSGTNGDAEVILEPSAFVQGLAAMSYQGHGGFTALFGLGYSVLLDEDNLRFVSGDEKTADIVRQVAGSGIVIEIGLGYAF